MPIYEYECDGCKEVFEVRQKMSDPPPTRHACGSEQVHRVLSATTFVLKGTGWYKTDYADKPRPKEGGADGGDKPRETKANGAGNTERGETTRQSKASDDGASNAKSDGKAASDTKAAAPSKGHDKNKTPAA